MEILSVGEMAAADRAAIAGGIAGLALMERAGSAVAEAVLGRWTKRPAVVLCGPGNNGGDGYVVARLLAAAGWNVTVGRLAAPAPGGDAAAMARRWTGETRPATPEILEGADLVVDALYGAGLSRPLDGAAAALAAAVNALSVPVVAVDLPSGVRGDDGAVLGQAMRAALTVTFFRPKPGHLLLPGRLLCGERVVADIGIPDRVLDEIGPRTFENDPALWRSEFPRPSPGDHKYRRGHALVTSGGLMSTGAARLAARAALRIGAGLVTLASPTEALAVNAAHLTAIMLTELGEPDKFAALLADRRRNALLLGPGNGLDGALKERVLTAGRSACALVLDADALSIFATEPETLFAALRSRPGNAATVLTPHEGEFRRLFPDLGGSKLVRARAAAAKSQAILVLKGADTIIAAPDGRAAINADAPPDLATAGSGDVLAGFVLGLLAQGMTGFAAAAAAVWLHGAAAARFGPGLIAEDLGEILPQVLRDLLAGSQSIG